MKLINKNYVIILAMSATLFGCDTMQKNNDNSIVDEIYPIESITDETLNEETNNLLNESGTDIIDESIIKEYEKVDISTKINFEFDSYKIKESDKKILKEHAKLLTKYDNIGVILEGHTDKIGDKSYNLVLGEKRANAVLEFLTSQGVKKEQLKVVSYGEEKPLMIGDSEEVNEQNRRVELKYK